MIIEDVVFPIFRSRRRNWVFFDLKMGFYAKIHSWGQIHSNSQIRNPTSCQNMRNFYHGVKQCCSLYVSCSFELRFVFNGREGGLGGSGGCFLCSKKAVAKPLQLETPLSSFLELHIAVHSYVSLLVVYRFLYKPYAGCCTCF